MIKYNIIHFLSLLSQELGNKYRSGFKMTYLQGVRGHRSSIYCLKNFGDSN